MIDRFTCACGACVARIDELAAPGRRVVLAVDDAGPWIAWGDKATKPHERNIPQDSVRYSEHSCGATS